MKGIYYNIFENEKTEAQTYLFIQVHRASERPNYTLLSVETQTT